MGSNPTSSASHFPDLRRGWLAGQLWRVLGDLGSARTDRDAVNSGNWRDLGPQSQLGIADGMQVTLTDRDFGALNGVRDSLKEQGGEVDVFEADLSDVTSVAKLIPAVLDRWGRIDALILNAAYHGTRQSVLETSIREWQEIFAVNVFAGAALSRAAARDMALRTRGSIVTVGSVQASLPAPGYAAYVSSKAAIEGMTRAFAVELAEFGIRVNCVAPGFIGTENYAANLRELAVDGDALPLASLSGQAGTPAHVAEVVAFLCDPGSNFVTGVTSPVDGGRSICRRADQPTYAGKKTSLAAVATACGCETVIECKAEDSASVLQSALASHKMSIIVCNCVSGNIPVQVIELDAPVIRHRFMAEVARTE